MKKPISDNKILLFTILGILVIYVLGLTIPKVYDWYKEVTYTLPQITIEEHKTAIESMLGHSASSLKDDITVEINTKEDGTQYCVGVISEKLNSNLPVLVDTFNFCLATNTDQLHKQITLDELRIALTDELELTYQKRLDYPDYASFGDDTQNQTKDYEYGVIEFFFWCNTEADLVYKGDVPHSSGSISNAGDDGPKNITNYEHSINKDDPNYDYCYRWEYEATQIETTQ